MATTAVDCNGRHFLVGRVVQWGSEMRPYCVACDHNPCECRDNPVFDNEPWRDDEDEFLMDLWSQCVPTKDIAMMLGRTKRACDMRICRNKQGFKVRRILIPDND